MSRASSGTIETGELFSYSLPRDLRDAFLQARKSWQARAIPEPPWLDQIDRQLGDLSRFKALSAEIMEDGFTHLLVLGTDRSISAPEVFSQVFGRHAGSPALLVLDSTDPAQIRETRSRIEPARTLFCVSSASETSTELELLVRYFFAETKREAGTRAGQNFIAITDPESSLASLAAEFGFRYIHAAESKITEAYSAFSDLALIPHAAAGYDTERFLKRVARAAHSSGSNKSPENSGVSLGLILAIAAAKSKRDKVTLICSPSLRGLGAWIEQVVASMNLIPINGEPFAVPENYGPDRIFVSIKYANDHDKEHERHICALEHAGQPVIRLLLEDLNDIAQAMLHWQLASAVAVPVDSPTENEVSRPIEIEVLCQDGIQLFADPTNAAALAANGTSCGGLLRRHLDRLGPGDYVGLFAFIPRFAEYREVLTKIRKQIVDAKQVATVVGFGPRFLHSTGQAFKRGPNTGVFLHITCDETDDLQIPGHEESFGSLKALQARGAFRDLAERNRRILGVHLGPDLAKGLNKLRDLICAAVEH